MNQRSRAVGRGALLRQLATPLPLSDESPSNISSATSNESLTLIDSSKISYPESDETGYGTSSTTVRPQGRGKILHSHPESDETRYVTSSTTVRPQGRGKTLQRILHANESISNDSFNLESAPKYGLGRGRILKILSEENEPPQNTADESIQSITDRTQTVSIESEESKAPVIKRGTKGKDIEVMTNYLQLNCDSTKGMYEYNVRFKPDVHAMSLRHRLLNQHKSKIGNANMFDGAVLYLPIKIPSITLISVSPNDGANYDVKIIFMRERKMSEVVQFYNILFNRVMKKLEYVKFGRKQFDPTAPKLIPQHKLEVWPGYVTAVEEYEGGLMLNLDVSHRLLCQSTVLDLLAKIYLSDKENLRQQALRSLLGTIIITRYNNHTYRIDDIDFDSSPRDTFLMNDREVSYIEYYKSHYNVDIYDENQPLLVSLEERKIAGKKDKDIIPYKLVPELCNLTGLTDTMRSDQKVMQDIATITRVTPEQRMFAYKKFSDNVNKSPEAKEILENWGLSIGEPRKLLGRQLEDETIIFGNGQCVAEKGDFNRYVTNHNMLNVVDLKDWLVLHTKTNANVTKTFIELMERNAGPMGMNVGRPTVVALNDDKPESYVQALRKCINKSLQIIVTICPSNRDDRYAAIKKICCAELPIPTQVINARTLSKEAKNRAIVQKIALQMNCKMGGSLWAINIPLKNVMICGIDTYHELKTNSVSAFIASLNPTFTKWFSRATIQQQKEELMNGLCQSVIAGLTAYRTANKMLPDKIIVYRDGVGDGQLAAVKNYEIPQMRKAFSMIDRNYEPGLTFIVVQKRINTRLFAIKRGKLENPEPGCVVDHTITRRYMYDFFLVPQNVRQGTVTPTHYVVVEDTSEYSPDILQRLSYKLCFLYYNWPGSVRVPACCQYAHKLAFLVGQSLKRQPSESLSDKLYFL